MGRPIGQLTGFFDAAGHPKGEHTLVVCGHVSEARKWFRFETQWKKALADVGIFDPFHMTDFMSCSKSFDGWKPRLEERVHLLTTLISIIKRNVYKGFSETVLLEDWKAVNEAYQLKESRCTPYALAAFFVMDRTIRWWGRKHPHDSMTSFVFEEGDADKGDFMWVMDGIVKQDRRSLKVAVPVFMPKARAELQAADLEGWAMRRAFKAAITKEPERSLPAPLVEVLIGVGKIPHLSGSLARDHLMKFCEAHDVPKRGEKRKWAGVLRSASKSGDAANESPSS